MPNVICFQAKNNSFATLNNVGVLFKSVLTDLSTRNFVLAKTSLRTRCVHARHRARILSSPGYILPLLVKIETINNSNMNKILS